MSSQSLVAASCTIAHWLSLLPSLLSASSPPPGPIASIASSAAPDWRLFSMLAAETLSRGEVVEVLRDDLSLALLLLLDSDDEPWLSLGDSEPLEGDPVTLMEAERTRPGGVVCLAAMP